MTTDERLDRLESRLSNSERQVGRYRKATMLMGVLLLAGVVMGQTARDGRFKEVRCESLSVIAEDGTKEVHLGGPTMFGGARVNLGTLGGTSHGSVILQSGDNNARVLMQAGTSSHLESPVGFDGWRNHNAGGYVGVKNTAEQEVVQLYADEYGNGTVGVWNRKGEGTLKPGP